MANKATNKQKKEDILDADLKYLIHEEDKLQEKIKDSSHLERFAKDLMLFMSLLKDYYKGNYRKVPYKTISAGVVGLIYTLNPIDIIPDFIPFIGHIDDALVLGFCLKLIEKDLKKYQIWKNSQSATTKKAEVKKQA
ncbi:YkvA family protein [Psychrobacter fjordensis]|uniref:YkvA family protein n=1 Tax=Psychrobacter fjordensis TaxID=664424 RepID=UPI001917C2AF|nr:YkvA family protein [Psychrobacter fjordensis]